MSERLREEVVDEAISLVVMAREPIRNEQHLLGAFWRSVGFLLSEHRAGRHALRVGSRRRVEFDQIAMTAPDASEPFDLVALRERVAQAADWMAQLDPFEQRVVALMSTRDVGVKLAAQALGEPVKTVLTAVRSSERKLEQVARISAAGRMCAYREPAIRAHAQGTAHSQQEQAAQAHLAACASCRRYYATMLRELRDSEFRRAASAAFLPPPLVVVEEHGWLGRLVDLIPKDRVPSGNAGERAAGLLGGGGAVKVAAAGTALVIAGAGVGARVIHSLERPSPVRRHKVARAAVAGAAHASIQPVSVPGAMTERQGMPAASRPVVTYRARQRSVAHRSPPPPSRGLGYLALGDSTGGSSSSPTARDASTRTSSGQEEGPPPRPTSTGGGTSLNYLGQ